VSLAWLSLLLAVAGAYGAGRLLARHHVTRPARGEPPAAPTSTSWPDASDAHLHADAAAFSMLLQSLPQPAWLFDAEGEAPRLLRCNSAALAWQRDRGVEHAAAAASEWELLCRGLPAGLSRKARVLTAGERAEEGGWSLQHCHDDGPSAGHHRWLLVMQQQPSPDGVDAEEAEAFSYTVSHDLRAPLRVVEGFTRILKEDYGRMLDRIGNDHLDRVLGAAARMHHMIDALLALSALSNQPLQREPVNLSQLAGFIVDDLRRESPRRTVDVHIAPNLVTRGDPTLLRVVLENLLGNAWKYSGKVERAEIVFEAVEHGGRQAYVVRDNGAGFDMRFADRLFGAFQRLHSASDFQGTGVGLASARRIVRRHGGDIWAESEVGRGAAFYFTLA
jgi:signal transduction histidine kinase